MANETGASTPPSPIPPRPANTTPPEQQAQPPEAKTHIPPANPANQPKAGSLMARRAAKKAAAGQAQSLPSLSKVPVTSAPEKTADVSGPAPETHSWSESSQTLFKRIEIPNGGGVTKARKLPATEIHTLKTEFSKLYGHSAPTEIDVTPYWEFVYKEKIPMIAQLETDWVPYLKDTPGEKVKNPEVLSSQVETGSMLVTPGTGQKVTDGVMRYSVNLGLKGGSTSRSTNVLRVVWPDQEAISAETLRTVAEQLPNGSAVHCKLGKGRTGTLIIAHQMIQAAKNGELTKDNVVSHIFYGIGNGRLQRGDRYFVQSQNQFDSLIELGKLLTSATDEEIGQQIDKLNALHDS